MSTYSEKIERHFSSDDFANKLKRKSSFRSVKLVRTEDDKRTRREVANNNERRRMQSINAGFESLRKLLPFCSDKEKISKATILQSTAKYIGDLKLKINSLENDVIRLKGLEKMSVNDNVIPVESDHLGEKESNKNSKTIKEEIQIPMLSISRTADSGSTSDLGSSLSSSMADNLSSALVNLNSEDDRCDSYSTINEPNGLSQQQNNLEQLLAAVEQVERLEAMQTISLKDDISYLKTNKSETALNLSPHSTSNCSTFDSTNFIVMKPMISPLTEKIIQDAVNMQIPYEKLTTSIIGSNSFILPLNCPTYMSSPMTLSTERILNHHSQKLTIPNNHLHRNNII